MVILHCDLHQYSQSHYKNIHSVSQLRHSCHVAHINHQQDQKQNVTEYHSTRLWIKASDHVQTVQITSSHEGFHLNWKIIIKLVVILWWDWCLMKQEIYFLTVHLFLPRRDIGESSTDKIVPKRDSMWRWFCVLYS
jgi:hypothetical protein